MQQLLDDSAVQAAVSILTVTTASLAGYLWAKYKHAGVACASENGGKELSPTKWVKVGNIAHLIMYPIKSCKGIYMDEAIATPLGFQGKKGSKTFRDRTLLLTDSHNREIDQGRQPRMVLIEVTMNDNETITLSAPDMDPVTFSLPENKPENRTICHLGKSDKNVPCLDCGDEVAAFFSKYLGKQGVRLVNYIEGETKEFRQLTTDQLAYTTFTRDVLGVFQNESSYLLIADESVTELNKHMNNQTTYRSFRPNVLVENIMEPFGELKWSYVRLGDGENAPILKNGRPCDRCPIVTNDPDTGVMDRTRESLKTLSSMSTTLDMGSKTGNTLMINRPVMGVRMGLNGSGGVVRSGDPVYAALL